jgi:hypothetical protein
MPTPRPLPRPERLVAQIGPRISLEHLLAFLDRIPKMLRHDAQLCNIPDDPSIAIIEPGNTPAGRRVLEAAPPIPDQLADVELVLEDAGSARGVAVDRRGVPFAAARSWEMFAVQLDGDPARRPAARELRKDPADDGGLGLVDPAAAANRLAVCVALADDVVAEAEAAARPSLPHPALKAAPRLVGEILQKQCVHRPLEADMQLGDLALGQRKQPHPGEAQALEQAGNAS